MKNSEIGDERLIHKLSPIRNPLEKIVSINGFEHSFDTSKVKDYKRYYGLIAQEIEIEFPHIVKETLKLNIHDDVLYKTIDHNQLVSVMVIAIKELNEKVNKLQEEINNDKNE
jgi:hypothetical protein